MIVTGIEGIEKKIEERQISPTCSDTITEVEGDLENINLSIVLMS